MDADTASHAEARKRPGTGPPAGEAEPRVESDRAPTPRERAATERMTYPRQVYPQGMRSPTEGGGVTGEITLERLLHVARRKWVTVTAVFFFVIVASMFYLRTATKVYRAESLIGMTVRRPRIAGQQAAVIDDTDAWQAEEIFNTRLEKFKGLTMLDRVVDMLGAATNAPAMGKKDLRDLVKKKVSISLIRRSHLVRISFDYADPAFAAAAANAYANAAEALAVEENKEASDDAVAWLQAQTRVQQKALEKADQALVEFDASNQIEALERQKQIVEQSIEGLNKVLTVKESEEFLARDLYDAVVALELKPEEAGKLPDSVPRASEIQTMLEQWLTASSERDALRTKYTSKHPEVVAQEKVIEVLRGQAMAALGRAQDTAASNLALFQQQAKSLREKIEEQSKLASELEMEILERKTKRTTLERERGAADISYKGILNRIEEARLSADEKTASVKVVERARIPEKPIRPNKARVLILGFLVGLAGGLGLAFATDTLEDRVVSAEDLEQDLGLKVLAAVPHVVGADGDSVALASLGDDLGQVVEAFAGVRGVLDSPQHRHVSDVVLVTGSSPEEGKTVTACNLAIACARAGKRTLLVDFDLRRPDIARIFKVPAGRASLIRALHDKDPSSFEMLPQATSCEGLDIVTTRAGTEISPADVIGGGMVYEFIEWARRTYDRVIIDSPPFGVVNDPSVLAGFVGSVILVCRPGWSRRRALRHASTRLTDVGANVIGVVASDVDFGRSFGFSNHGYYYAQYKNYYASDHEGNASQKAGDRQRGSEHDGSADQAGDRGWRRWLPRKLRG